MAKLAPGMTVRVKYWNTIEKRFDTIIAVLDHHLPFTKCWQLKQPCKVVWAHRDDIELER